MKVRVPAGQIATAKVSVDDRNRHRWRRRRRHRRAGEARFEPARVVAAVVVARVAVVALFGVKDGAVTTARDAGATAAAGFELTVRAAVADFVVAVFTGLDAFNDAVTTPRRATHARTACALKARRLPTLGAAIVGVAVAVVAGLETRGDAVATDGVAASTGLRALVAALDRADAVAAVAVARVAVVAGLAATNAAVATLDDRDAVGAGVGADEVELNRGAVAIAAVAEVAVAVVADLVAGQQAIAAACRHAGTADVALPPRFNDAEVRAADVVEVAVVAAFTGVDDTVAAEHELDAGRAGRQAFVAGLDRTR